MPRKWLFVLWALLCLGAHLSAQQIVTPVSGVATLDVERNSKFKVIVNQNITSVVIAPSVGVPNLTTINILFVENSVGGFSVTFGGNTSGTCTVTSTAGAGSSCSLQFDSASNTWFFVGGGGSFSTPQNNPVTWTLSLLSSATVTSITNVSSTSATFTCSATPGCGLTPFSGGTVNVGQGLDSLPISCQGAATISGTAGNTVTLTGMLNGPCATSSSSFRSIWGTLNPIVNIVPAQGNNPPGGTPTQYTQWFMDYDGHTNLTAIYNGVNRSQLDIDTTGQAWLTDFNNPVALGTEATTQARATGGAGGLCFANVPTSSGCVGTEFLLDSANNILLRAVKYGGISFTAPASIAPTGTTSTPANQAVQTGGFPAIVVEFVPASAITPTAGATTTVSVGTIFTAPASNYGAGAFYELKGVLVCSSNCANAQTAFVTVTYNDGIGARSLSTCGTPGAAGNTYAVCTANPTTAWNLTTSASMPFDFASMLVAGSQTISLSVTTTNGGVAQPVYFLGYGLELH